MSQRRRGRNLCQSMPGLFMRELIDRAMSIVLSVAAVLVAGALVHREFFTDNRGPERPKSEYVAAWRNLVEQGRAVGPPNAPVTLIEFADFECPFCGKFNGSIQQVLRRYPQQVDYVFIHMPIASHRHSLAAARAAECAQESGRFGSMVDALFRGQDSLGTKPWTSFAREAGVIDTARFAACARDTTSMPIVQSGAALGEKMRIRGTPTVLLNGWMYGVPPSDTELVRAIGDLLAGKRPYGGFPKSGLLAARESAPK